MTNHERVCVREGTAPPSAVSRRLGVSAFRETVDDRWTTLVFHSVAPGDTSTSVTRTSPRRLSRGSLSASLRALDSR